MNQILPTRLPALDDFPMREDITIRVGDLDGYGHLNAIRTGAYYEDARAAFYRPAFEGLPHMRSLVAQMNTRYIREGFWPGTITVGTGIARIGNASFEMAQALFQNGACIGTCLTTMVHTVKGRSAPLPQAARERLALYLVAAPGSASTR